MRNRFDQQLELLNEQLIRMGELCEVAIGKATTALKEGSMEQAQKVIEADEEIDQAETDIERLCLKLLLQQQPVARDLRQISAALKMITDMERIGDQLRILQRSSLQRRSRKRRTFQRSSKCPKQPERWCVTASMHMWKKTLNFPEKLYKMMTLWMNFLKK